MPFIAVDKNGKEYICSVKPERDTHAEWWSLESYGYLVEVPQGTSLKLTGKQLTWEDEPVELT